jgi:hypothetical protein
MDLTENLPVNITTWREAEELAARHMVSIGFSDAVVTGGGTDGGVDVVADGGVAQVKFHAMPVGAPDVQRLKGAALDVPAVLFYSAAGYTPGARTYADTAKVALFIIGPWSAISAVNTIAEDLISGVTVAEKAERVAAAERYREVAVGRYDALIGIWKYMNQMEIVRNAPNGVNPLVVIDELEAITDHYTAAVEGFVTRYNAGASTLDQLDGFLDEIDVAVRQWARLFGHDMDAG